MVEVCLDRSYHHGLAARNGGVVDNLRMNVHSTPTVHSQVLIAIESFIPILTAAAENTTLVFPFFLYSVLNT